MASIDQAVTNNGEHEKGDCDNCCDDEDDGYVAGEGHTLVVRLLNSTDSAALARLTDASFSVDSAHLPNEFVFVFHILVVVAFKILLALGAR